MFLDELFDRLSYIELSQSIMGGGDLGEIQPETYPKVIHAVNAGMLKLYEQFALALKTLYIQQFDHITRYKIHNDYAVSNVGSAEPYKWIIDTAEDPFTNDFIKIEEVFDEEGAEVPLNDTSDINSVFTPIYNVLQIPAPDNANATVLVYRAAPTKLDPALVDPTTAEIDLPFILDEALIAYVTHILVAGPHIGGAEESNKYLQRYLALVGELQNNGSLHTEHRYNNRLEKNGWV